MLVFRNIYTELHIRLWLHNICVRSQHIFSSRITFRFGTIIKIIVNMIIILIYNSINLHTKGSIFTCIKQTRQDTQKRLFTGRSKELISGRSFLLTFNLFRNISLSNKPTKKQRDQLKENKRDNKNM